MSLAQWGCCHAGWPHTTGRHLCAYMFVHTEARVQLGTRVVSTNGKAPHSLTTEKEKPVTT